MPHHKSAKKRVRQSVKRHLRNRLHITRMRSLIKRLRSTEDKDSALVLLSETKSCLDRLASKGVIPANKASNYKSNLEKHVQALS